MCYFRQVVFLLYFVVHRTRGQYFLTFPSDACAFPTDVVDFSCTTVFINGALVIQAQQEWVVTPPSGPVIQFSSFQTDPLPSGFNFIPGLSGIRVTATSDLNNATVQCIAVQTNTGVRNNSELAIATLQVAVEPGEFSCWLVSCPPLYSPGVDTTCTVQWSAPWTVDCAPLTSYTITTTRRDNGEVVSNSSQGPSDSRIHGIIVPAPAVKYKVAIAAVNIVGPTMCVVEFTSPSEQEPQTFALEVTVTAVDNVTIVPSYMGIAPRPLVAKYLVVLEDGEHNIHGPWNFTGSSSFLSLDISSLPPCENYTVSVTASNTGGSATTNTTLSLDPLTTLEASCVGGKDGCYLEASCVPSQSWLVSGCRLDYTSSAGSASRNVTQFNINNIVTAVSCDNQTISYTGTAYGSMLRPLGCTRNSTTRCPFLKDCTPLSIITNGTVQYSTEPIASGFITNGTVATYSCADGYEVVGEVDRTCLVDGTWTGAEPNCTANPSPAPSPTTGLPGWAVAIIVIIILVVVALVVALVTFLLWKRVFRGKYSFSRAERSRSSKAMVVSQDDLEMEDKADYEVVGPGNAQGQAKAQPPAPQKNPDGLVYADVGTFHERPRRIPPPPKEPEGVQYSAVMFLKEKSPEAVKPLPADDLLTLDNLLRQLSTVVHAWYIIGEHLGLANVLLEQIKETGLAVPDAMVEVVDNWLRGHKGQPLWREVVAVLVQAGFTQLAADINRVGASVTPRACLQPGPPSLCPGTCTECSEESNFAIGLKSRLRTLPSD